MVKSLVGLKKHIARSSSSIYAFPVLLVFVLIVLTALKINGSSYGIYNLLTEGSSANNQNLLYGHPRSIRSDEYVTLSTITALQYQSGFPSVNKDLGGGKDVAIVPDAPTKNWLTFFRPQNWSFFVMPLDSAFAFHWWFGMILLTMSAYFFLLRMLDGKRLISILFSLAFSFSPYFLWWFRNDLFLPMAYGFLMMSLAMRIINQEKIPRLKSMLCTNFIYVLVLGYLGTSFVLLLYAPFLISIFLVVAVFCLGYLIDQYSNKSFMSAKQVLQRIAILLSPALIIAPIVLAFYREHGAMIHAIANSAYPGHRQEVSGSLPFSRLYRFFDGFLQPLLQHPPEGHFYTNQSEASNFILLLPFLLIPGIILQAYGYLKYKRINWTFLGIQLLSVLFILRITVPAGDGFYGLLLLNRVPNNRLMAGVGLLGFLQLILLIKYLPSLKFPKKLWVFIASSISMLTLAWLLVFAKFFFRDYLTHKYLFIAGGLALLFSAIIAAFLFGKKTLGAALFLLFTAGSSFYIMPIEKGLPFIDNSRIVNAIKADSGPNDSWAVVDDFAFETVPWMAGREMVSGPQIYPDPKFWRQLDPSSKLDIVYNREGHALFISDSVVAGPFLSADFAKKMHQNVQLVKGNVFKIRFTCSSFTYKNVDYVLTTHRLNMSCLVPVENVTYPQVTFYIYRVTHPI